MGNNFIPENLLDKNNEIENIDEVKEINKIENILEIYNIYVKCVKVKCTLHYRIYEINLISNKKIYKIGDIEKLKVEIGMFYNDIDKVIITPIPSKRLVGIYMRKKERENLLLGTLISENNDKEKMQIPITMGIDLNGNKIRIDLDEYPHLLVTGTTGSGKTNFLNNIIIELINNYTANEQKIILIDTRAVNFSLFNGIPHMLIPAITDNLKALYALDWIIQEMRNRYILFSQKNVRDLKSYNEITEYSNNNKNFKLPQICVFIDDLSDLMDTYKEELQKRITILSQEARAAGIYLILSTYRPSVNILNGIVKANISNRLVFKTAMSIDSKIVIDQGGAEKLDKGEALFKNNNMLNSKLIEVPLISEDNIKNIVNYFKCELINYNETIIKFINTDSIQRSKYDNDEIDDIDPLLMEVIDDITQIGQVSTSYIQTRFKIGYARAGKIIEQLEARGIISGYEGSKPRKVIIQREKVKELNDIVFDEVITANLEENEDSEDIPEFEKKNKNYKVCKVLIIIWLLLILYCAMFGR